MEVLSFALQDDIDNCKTFVDALGLKTLFAALMKKVGAMCTSTQDNRCCRAVVLGACTDA
jgi:hypothetical protein